MGYQNCQLHIAHTNTKLANLDVLPEVLHASFVVLIPRPLAPIDGYFPRHIQTVQRFVCKVLNAVDIRLADLVTLSTVIQIVPRNRGCDRNKNEPVPRGKLGSFVKP